MPVYDSYSAVRRLMEAGVSEEQAVAIVREQFTFVENLATKDDVAALRQDLRSADLRMTSEFTQVRSEIKAMEARLTKYVTSLAVAMAGAIVALVKIL